MKRRFRQAVFSLWVVGMLLGAMRLGLTVWRCETGWDTLAISWKDATIGWFG